MAVVAAIGAATGILDDAIRVDLNDKPQPKKPAMHPNN
jgi:hypothetical protein